MRTFTSGQRVNDTDSSQVWQNVDLLQMRLLVAIFLPVLQIQSMLTPSRGILLMSLLIGRTLTYLLLRKNKFTT